MDQKIEPIRSHLLTIYNTPHGMMNLNRKLFCLRLIFQKEGALEALNVYSVHLLFGLFGIPDGVCYYNFVHRVDTSVILDLEYPNLATNTTAGKDVFSLMGGLQGIQ
ncbi:MAG TPA: hypothetical protein VGC17_03055 [Lactovum miscens]|uniref:hypothetical protein n=1 Tax=Lactovum miscens TaxID=190387 RepID=UPI002EDA9ACD